MLGRPVFDYRREYEFALTPAAMWERMEHLDQFESWWPWLQEYRLEGGGLTPGSVLHGVVVPPLPYRMAIRVELTRCEQPGVIDALVGGDLEGEAHLRVRAEGIASRVEVAWTVEMMQRPMRLASRFGRPLLQWGHDRVVEMTVERLSPETRGGRHLTRTRRSRYTTPRRARPAKCTPPAFGCAARADPAKPLRGREPVI